MKYVSDLLAQTTNEDYELPSKSTQYEVTSKSTSSSKHHSQSDKNGEQIDAPAGHHLVTNEDYEIASTWFDGFPKEPSNSPNVPLQASTPLGTPDNEISQSSRNGSQFDVQAGNNLELPAKCTDSPIDIIVC